MHTFTLLLLILLIYNIFGEKCYSYFSTNMVESEIDGNAYKVISEYDDQQKAANMMSELNLFATNVIKNLKYKYLILNPANREQLKGYEVASILEKRYTQGSLSENKPTSDKDTSYTQNKGEIISLCLREKKSGNNNFHNLDDLKFVLLHEMAHIVTPELDHSVLFWNNFRFLLEFCKKYNLYESPNYEQSNVVYCGLTVKYNPMYDKLNRTITYFDIN